MGKGLGCKRMVFNKIALMFFLLHLFLKGTMKGQGVRHEQRPSQEPRSEQHMGNPGQIVTFQNSSKIYILD